MPTTATSSALQSRRRAREQRLFQASERRLRLDPDRLARDQRIDEATVDVEEAKEALTSAQAAVVAAELSMASGVERLLAETVSVAQVCQLTGLDRQVVRRLRQLNLAKPEVPADSAAVRAEGTQKED